MRAFLDRFRRITRGEGFKEGVAGKPAVGVCVAGGSGNGAPNCCMSLDRAIVWCGFFVAEMAAVRRQNLQAKLPGLRQVGQWLAEAGPDLK